MRTSLASLAAPLLITVASALGYSPKQPAISEKLYVQLHDWQGAVLPSLSGADYHK